MINSRYGIYIFTICFVGFISFPLINDLTKLVSDLESTENRALAKKPEFNINLLDPFPVAYEKYYNDHFSLRSRSVKLFNEFNLRVFKKPPPSCDIAIGKEDWLYLKGLEMDCYLGTKKFANEDLSLLRTELLWQKNELEKRGCKFYFMITPAKANAHPENVPATYYVYDEESLGEQLNKHLLANTEINVISLYEPFDLLRKEHDLYFKLDNHWNRKGAFFAASEAIKVISKDFNGISPLNYSDYTTTPVRRDSGDIAKLLGFPSMYKDYNYTFTRKIDGTQVIFDPINYIAPFQHPRNQKTNNPYKLFLMGDSFSNSLFPFLSEKVDSTLDLFDYWQYKLDLDLIDREKPDIYLLTVHEPFLWNIVSNKRAAAVKK